MKEKCSFAMAAPPTPPTGWLTLPKSHLTLQRHIHHTSAVALHLLHGSIALSPRQHHTTVKTHREPQLGATVGCRKAGAHHTAWDSCLSSVKMKQPLDSLWKEMRNGNSLGQRRGMMKDNSPHCRKGWRIFLGRRQCRRTCQMDGEGSPSWFLKPIKHLHIPPRLGKEEVSAGNYLSLLFKRGCTTWTVYGVLYFFFLF